jgi:hypothetical protein
LAPAKHRVNVLKRPDLQYDPGFIFQLGGMTHPISKSPKTPN